MKLRKVISGGQTGADKTGLECAKELGLETGGTAPRLWRTEIGVDRSLEDYGLVESPYYDYAPRTRQNVQDADVTVWFGNVGSPGYWCTLGAAANSKKPFHVNPTHDQMRELAEKYEVWNVAGNRASKNKEVCAIVREAFKALS